MIVGSYRVSLKETTVEIIEELEDYECTCSEYDYDECWCGKESYTVPGWYLIAYGNGGIRRQYYKPFLNHDEAMEFRRNLKTVETVHWQITRKPYMQEIKNVYLF